MLDRVDLRQHVVELARIGQRDGPLHDHRSGIEAVVGEVHRHAEQLDAVGERLADRVDPGKRRKQRLGGR